MTTITVGSGFQVVLPRKTRELLNISVGQKLHVSVDGDRIQLIPVKPIQQMRGFLDGMDSSIERDDDRV